MAGRSVTSLLARSILRWVPGRVVRYVAGAHRLLSKLVVCGAHYGLHAIPGCLSPNRERLAQYPFLIKQYAQHYYERLSLELKNAGLSALQRERILQAVGDLTLPDGTRWWRREKEWRWRQALAAHWLVEKKEEQKKEESEERIEMARYQVRRLPLVWVEGAIFRKIPKKKNR